ncbi:MAG: PAS domain-containing protein [Deltaproteobacteria bacterium]|nr:PAS domain-containing protein [Deltaproteobacteria bacterium]
MALNAVPPVSPAHPGTRAQPRRGGLSAPLRQLLTFRLLLITLLLGVLILIDFIWPRETSPTPLYSFIIVTYLLTIHYARLTRFRIREERLIQQQLLVDATLIAVLLYLTGGFYSLFFPLFYFIILGGTLYLKSQQTVTLLFYCTFLYLSVVFAHIYNPLQDYLPLPPLLSNNRKIVSELFFNLAPFYLTAFILRFMARESLQNREKLEEVTSDLKDFKDLNEHIIASIDSGLITTDEKMRINFINQSGCQILGLEENAIRGRELGRIIPDLPPQAGGSRSTRHEISYQGPDNRRLTLGFSLTQLLKSPNRKPGWILIFQDLTEFKTIEEGLQGAKKMAAIGRLAAGIAHEIRNPLAAISGSIEILARDLADEDETHQRLLQIVLRESNRLNHLISDFLSFSRLEEKTAVCFNIISLLQDMIFLFRSQFPETVFTESYHGSDCRVNANPEQVEQILWNLCKNALEAVNGRGRIEISSYASPGGEPFAGRGEPGGQRVEIHICDNGPGLDEAGADRIFEPFFTTKTEGTGLGLYIVFQLVKINHGSVRLQNRVTTSGTCAILGFNEADATAKAAGELS